MEQEHFAFFDGELGNLWLNASLSELFPVIMSNKYQQKWNGIDCELLTNAVGLHLNNKSLVTENVSFPVT